MKIDPERLAHQLERDDEMNTSGSRLSEFHDVPIVGFVDSDAASYISESDPESSEKESVCDTTLENTEIFDLIQNIDRTSEQMPSKHDTIDLSSNENILNSPSNHLYTFGKDSDNEMDTTSYDDEQLLADSRRLFSVESRLGYNDRSLTFFDRSETLEHLDNSSVMSGITDNELQTTSLLCDTLLPSCADSGYLTHPMIATQTANAPGRLSSFLSPKRVELLEKNTYYEMPIDQTELFRLEKHLKGLDAEKEVEKMIKDPDGSATFNDVFKYLHWKLADAGFGPERQVLSIGKKEEVISMKHDGDKIDLKLDDPGSIMIEPENHLNKSIVSENAINPEDINMEDVYDTTIFSDCYRMTGTQNDDHKIETLNSELDNQEVVRPMLLPSLLVSPVSKEQPGQASPVPIIESSTLEKDSGLITKKIEKEIQKFIEALINRTPLVIRVRNRNNWDNCVLTPANTISLKSEEAAEFKQINFNHQGSEKYFTLIVYLLGEIYSLLMTNTTSTKRELYYRDPELTESQRNVDMALNDISCFLDEPLWKLGVLSSSKGLVAGNLVIVMNDDTLIDGRQERGVVVPADICAIKEIKSDAKYILIVEKDTVFKKLLDDNVFLNLGSNLILITVSNVKERFNGSFLYMCAYSLEFIAGQRLSGCQYSSPDQVPYRHTSNPCLRFS